LEAKKTNAKKAPAPVEVKSTKGVINLAEEKPVEKNVTKESPLVKTVK